MTRETLLKGINLFPYRPGNDRMIIKIERKDCRVFPNRFNGGIEVYCDGKHFHFNWDSAKEEWV